MVQWKILWILSKCDIVNFSIGEIMILWCIEKSEFKVAFLLEWHFSEGHRRLEQQQLSMKLLWNQSIYFFIYNPNQWGKNIRFKTISLLKSFHNIRTSIVSFYNSIQQNSHSKKKNHVVKTVSSWKFGFIILIILTISLSRQNSNIRRISSSHRILKFVASRRIICIWRKFFRKCRQATVKKWRSRS